MLTGGTRVRPEQLVAAGPVARMQARILWLGGCALALAQRRRCSCSRGRRPSLAHTLAVRPVLLPPPRLARVAGPVTLRRPPTPPTTGGLPTGVAAIAGLVVCRPEPALAALEQTTPAAVALPACAGAFLTRPGQRRILWRAQGRGLLPNGQVSGGSYYLPSETPWPVSPVWCGEPVNLPSKCSRAHTYPALLRLPQPSARPRAPTLRSSNRTLALLALRKWLGFRLRLTSR